VFTFLPGHWLFIGAVCREWQALYAGIEDQQVCSFYLDYNSELFTCGRKTTLYSAAVASPVTARLARSSGLAIPKNVSLQAIAGLHVGADTLTSCESSACLSVTLLLKQLLDQGA
jgi:hypothetical protein